MKVKKLAGIMMVGLMATYAHGQQFGVPIATDASPALAGTFDVSGGIVLGKYERSDINLYGGRFTFNLTDELSLFGDAGLVDPDWWDMGFGVQGGALFRLPEFPDVPMDFGVRGTLGYSKNSRSRADLDVITINAAGLASYTIDDMFSVYGVLGLAYIRAEVSEGRFSSSNSETEPVVGVGVLANFTPELSAYAEFVHIESAWIGLGGKFRF